MVIVSENEYNAMLKTINSSSRKSVTKKIKEGEKEDVSKMSTYNPSEKW